MSKIKIGIIGTGYIGNVHGQIYSQDARCEISALFDIVSEKAERTARSIGGKVCASRKEFLENCDAVLVTTPNKTHTEIAVEANTEFEVIFVSKPFQSDQNVISPNLALGDEKKIDLDKSNEDISGFCAYMPNLS